MRDEKTAEKIYDIPISEIEVADENARQTEPERDLDELADSIRRHGQLQPVILRGEFGKPKYELIIGQRRYLAHKEILKSKTLKAVFAGKINKIEAKIRSLAENMCRVELGYKDAADAITFLYKHFQKNDKRVERETGLSLKKIRQYIYIEERASEQTKQKLRAKKVKPVDVERVLQASCDNIGKADELLDLMNQYKLDGYQKKRLREYGQAHPSASAKQIIERAKEPTVEQSFVVKLSERARTGLLKAAKMLAMAPDELAARAVEEWLSTKGFVS